MFLTACERLLCHYLLSKIAIKREHSLEPRYVFYAMGMKSRKIITFSRRHGKMFQLLEEAVFESFAPNGPAKQFSLNIASIVYYKNIILDKQKPCRNGKKDSKKTRKQKSEMRKKKRLSPKHHTPALSTLARV